MRRRVESWEERERGGWREGRRQQLSTNGEVLRLELKL